MKQRLKPITIGILGLALAGCRAPQRVIDELPAPYFQPWSGKIARPPPPPSPRPPTRSRVQGTVVVDAGHGGKDPGSDAKGLSPLPEKTIVLAVAREVARRLTDRGAKVVATRDRDVFIELDDRAAIAERTRADLFISIHADWARRTSASGATFYIARNASSKSRRAALRLNAAFRRAGIETRGVDRAGFRVLVGHSRPAVLIECGFLSNPQERRLLNTLAYRSKLAAAIAAGVADYLSQ